ncbi:MULTISPECIES: PilZ domain-containing protein [unclassified Hahella]|uniref:PilZ domain-containing protein n=1 Tax=unclassified Hahella TaxID=2624107 RepID=UPI001F4EC55F|nr:MULTISPECIES: PilZ domain-containing protein [unclassified Hahella]MDG9667473.1 PilZ domain-containing protein [Hahella sp. CR1]
MRLTTMRDYSEKRDFIRMKVDSEIVLTIADTGRSLTGVCKDLSGAGMSIEIGEPFAEGAEFQTSLPSSNEAFPSFETIVRVIRCTPVSEDRYVIGVEITKVVN